jgi:hypothetical protein
LLLGQPRWLRYRIEAVRQPPAVDVECFEDVANGEETDVPVEGPANDVEVFLSGFEAVEDAVEKEGLILEAALEEAEVAAVELDPEAFALQMLKSAGPEVAPPVVLHPATNGALAQVAARFLALKPFIK